MSEKLRPQAESIKVTIGEKFYPFFGLNRFDDEQLKRADLLEGPTLFEKEIEIGGISATILLRPFEVENFHPFVTPLGPARTVREEPSGKTKELPLSIQVDYIVKSFEDYFRLKDLKMDAEFPNGRRISMLCDEERGVQFDTLKYYLERDGFMDLSVYKDSGGHVIMIPYNSKAELKESVFKITERSARTQAENKRLSRHFSNVLR